MWVVSVHGPTRRLLGRTLCSVCFGGGDGEEGAWRGVGASGQELEESPRGGHWLGWREEQKVGCGERTAGCPENVVAWQVLRGARKAGSASGRWQLRAAGWGRSQRLPGCQAPWQPLTTQGTAILSLAPVHPAEHRQPHHRSDLHRAVSACRHWRMQGTLWHGSWFPSAGVRLAWRPARACLTVSCCAVTFWKAGGV